MGRVEHFVTPSVISEQIALYFDFLSLLFTKQALSHNIRNDKIVNFQFYPLSTDSFAENYPYQSNNGPCHLSGIPLQKRFFPLSQRDFYFINCC
jgi:hypothetical protein